MSQSDRSARTLASWYRKRVKPFLGSEDPDRISEFDRDLRNLEEREQSLENPLAVCFVGGAGVGKSTLINAMVAGGDTVVPSGGVGPLTAQAIQIDFADTPAFTAIYHAPASLWKIGFALESAIRREHNASSDHEEDADLLGLLDEETVQEVNQQALGDAATSKTETYRKQAQLLLTGDQERVADLGYLADGIREAIGRPRKWGTLLREDDRPRLERLKEIFITEHTSTEAILQLDGHADDFEQQLHDHAAGFLSPVIKKLDVGWPSGFLEAGIRLVDLPGLGISGDVYREISDEWVRNRAKTIVLVVTHRGITEADAQLLRSSGFLTRLLHSADDPTADPVSLVVAVVRTDEIAGTRRQTDKSKSKREHLADVMEECSELVKSQLKSCIAKAWSSNSAELGEGKQKAIERIGTSLNVYSLSTIEYRRFLIDDEDEVPFIKDVGQSGVPSMVSGVQQLAEENRTAVRNRFAEALDSLHERVVRHLELIKARWEEGNKAKEEAESLRVELEHFTKPLREEFRARQGGYRNFLKETLPTNIETVVSNASIVATKEIRCYLRKLRDANWRTLQAAVRRDGTFYGARHINLPCDFAMAFEDPIAELWSKSILSELRKHNKAYSDDCLSFVDKMVVWAKEQGGRVQPRLIEAQRDAIAADTKHLSSVGKTAVNTLRDTVRSKLSAAIEGPIRIKCQAFICRDEHVGRGVRVRILDLFDDLADDSIEAAKTPAYAVLLENYRIVEAEIIEAWRNHQDPIASAAEAIVASHEDSLKRSDAQRRKKVLDSLNEILESMPDHKAYQ